MIEILVTTTSQYADDISEKLTDFGAVAITWQDAGDQPIYEPKPGQSIEWNEMQVSALFERHISLVPVQIFLKQLEKQGSLIQYDERELIEQDWVRINQELHVPMQFGQRLWICPTNHAFPDPNAVNVRFNPGLAFGTGSHPTTSLCLEWLEQNVCGGETLIDYGCGSGILAVAALKLGAKSAIGVDYDTQALDATRMNAELNEFSQTNLKTYLPEELVTEPVDVLVANILAQPLIELAPRLAALVKPKGKIILSGVLTNQYQDILSLYKKWFLMNQPVIKEDWVRLEGMRRRI